MRARRRFVLCTALALVAPLAVGLPGPAGAAADDRGLLVPAGGPYTVGTTPYSLAVADLDVDGDLDIAIANTNGNTVSVLLGDGHGIFSPAPGSPFSASHVAELRVGFVNGDALPDLVTIRKDPDIAGQTDYLLTFLGTGGGGFAASPQSPVIGPRAGDGLVLDDLTGDGTLDAAYTNTFVNVDHYEHVFAVLEGGGDGTWTEVAEYTDRVVPNGGSGTTQSAIVAVDLDGDDDRDIALADPSNKDVSTWFNDGAGGFTPGARTPLARFTGDMLADDVDGDGDDDLLVANFSYFSVSVLLNDGSGALSLAPWSPISVPGGANDLALGDVDDDGQTDLVAGAQGSFEVLLGDGTGHYVRGWGSPYTAPNLNDLQVGDLDGDGFADVARTDNSADTVRVLLSTVDNAPPSLTVTVEPDAPASGWYAEPPVVDVSAVDVGAAGMGTLRCVTNPVSVPTTYADLPNQCVLAPEAERLNHLYVAATDAVGNTSAVQHLVVGVDSVAPTTDLYATTSSAATGWHTEAPSAIVVADDAVSGVARTRCVVDPLSVPTTYADLPDECDKVTDPLGDGVHHVYAASIDEAGNAGPVASRELRVDTTPPVVQAAGVQPDPVVQGDDAQALMAVTDSTSGFDDYACEQVSTQHVGPGQVTCRAWDVAGNETVHVVDYEVVAPLDAAVAVHVERAEGTRLVVEAVVTDPSLVGVGDLVLTFPDSLRIDEAEGCTVEEGDVTCPVTTEAETSLSVLVTPRGPGPHPVVAVIPPGDADSSNDTDAAVARKTLVCDNDATADADVVEGTDGADILCGLAGDDVLRGLEGDDLLFGGAGEDEVSYAGAPGTRVDLRLQGIDVVGARPRSGEGHGEDSITGIESARGGSFADLLTGDAFVNRLFGGAGADQLTGLGSIDFLFGGAGADVCKERADHRSSC